MLQTGDTRKDAQALPSDQCRKQNTPKQSKRGQVKGERSLGGVCRKREPFGMMLEEWDRDGERKKRWCFQWKTLPVRTRRRKWECNMPAVKTAATCCPYLFSRRREQYNQGLNMLDQRQTADLNSMCWAIGNFEGFELRKDTINLMSKPVLNICKSS